jgi:hypothetical protein
VAAKRSYFYFIGYQWCALAERPNGGSNMALRKMRTAEHEETVEKLDREIREFVRHEVVTNPAHQRVGIVARHAAERGRAGSA